MLKKITELEIAAAVKTLSATERGRAALASVLELADEPRVVPRTHESRAVIVLLVAACQGAGHSVNEAIAQAIGEPAHA